MKKFITRSAVIVMLLFSVCPSVYAQEWNVPDSKKKKVATFVFSEESKKKGGTLYNANCASCHGNPGKKNFASLNPSPGDPASERYQLQTDGEMYYKITNGRSPMPSFKSILLEEERWNIISYIRSFNSTYVQPELSTDTAESEYTIDMIIEKLADSNQIRVTAYATSLKLPERVVVEGADVSLFVKRYFGLMQIGEKKITDKYGVAIFNFPEDIPGDTSGVVNLVVKIADETGDYGESEVTARMLIGKPTKPESLIDTRAMWSVSSRAPYWVLIAYIGAVLLVLSCIGYILHQLHRVYKFGREKTNDKNDEL